MGSLHQVSSEKATTRLKTTGSEPTDRGGEDPWAHLREGSSSRSFCWGRRPVSALPRHLWALWAWLFP